MDRQVKKIVVIASVVFLCVMGYQLKAGKQQAIAAVAQPQAEPEPAVAVVESASFNRNTFADVEAKREQELENKRNAQELVKQQNKKGKSVECLFWKQQKLHSSTANVDEKIEHFCNL